MSGDLRTSAREQLEMICNYSNLLPCLETNSRIWKSSPLASKSVIFLLCYEVSHHQPVCFRGDAHPGTASYAYHIILSSLVPSSRVPEVPLVISARLC